MNVRLDVRGESAYDIRKSSYTFFQQHGLGDPVCSYRLVNSNPRSLELVVYPAGQENQSDSRHNTRRIPRNSIEYPEMSPCPTLHHGQSYMSL